MAQEIINSPLSPAAPAAEHAATAHAAEHDAPAEHGHDQSASRKTAIWLFLGSEVIFFAVLMAAYMSARWKDPRPHEILNIPLTSLNTFVLLTSSYTVVRALSAIQQGNRTRFLRYTFLSIVFGATFVGIQFFEYSNLYAEGLTLSSSMFGAAFFSLTGFHGAHVIIGVCWLIAIFFKGFNGQYGPGKASWGVELAGLYWHFVDVIWIVLFTLIYLI